MQPGQTITPNQQPTDGDQTTEKPVEKLPLPVQEVQSAPSAAPEAPALTSQFQSETEQVFTGQEPEYIEDDTAVRWTASEYVDHVKGPLWFVGLGAALSVLLIIVYLLLKDVLAAVLVGLAGVTFGVFAGRRPQVLEYAVDSQGIHIGQRSHTFSEFKSFSLTQAGPLPAILLMPLKRFLPPITIFYDPKEEDKIIDALANYLPHEDREPDLVDRLMGRIRF